MASSLVRGRRGLALTRSAVVAALVTIGCGVSAFGCGNNSTPDPAAKPASQSEPRSDAYVPLARGAHPLVRPELDRGPLDPDKVIANLSLAFKLTPAQTADRDALIAAQLDPGSPSYHKWLTPQTYAARFGASADVIARSRAWLAQQGLTVHETSPLGARVTFSGKVSDLQNAFKAPMRRYEVGGKMHYAMATAPSVPSELGDAVLGVRRTHDFYPQPMNRLPPKPAYGSPGHRGVGPADWANIYDATKLYTQGVSGTPVTGAGVTIGIVDCAQIGQSDIDQFRTTFGLPPSTVTMTLVPNTGTAQPGPTCAQPGSGGEAYLDVEWSGGIAPGATINYVFTGNDDGDPDDATYYIIENNLADIISESWGGCEIGTTPSDADIFAVYGSAAELLGISYLNASGDSGATGCINYGVPGLYATTPANFPGVTAVGGTDLLNITYDASTGLAVGYGTGEQCWNDGNNPSQYIAAASGGISNFYPRPFFQASTPTCTAVGTLPTSANPASMRMLPDVAFNAGIAVNSDLYMCQLETVNGITDCGVNGTHDTVMGVGGTSIAAPAFAGVVALVAQATGGGRLGNINPLLYTLAATTPSAFHDIALGNNEISCKYGTDPGCPSGELYGYPATAGYDCATGLGSVDAYNLVSAWAKLAPTTISLAAAPTTTTPGTSVNLTATLAVPTPNADVLSGQVRFGFQSYTTNGIPDQFGTALPGDLSWTLGIATVTGATVSGGSAALSVAIPVGMINPAAQYVDVVAMYGGDANHLASTSAKVRITFSQAALCLVPSFGTLLPGEGFTFSYTGGTAPLLWEIAYDSTCDQYNNCSTLDPRTGVFRAGPTWGWVVIEALDANGVMQFANLTVGDVPAEAGVPPWLDAQAPLGGCNAPPPDAGFTVELPDADLPHPDASTGPVDSGGPIMDGAPQDTGVATMVDASTDAEATDASVEAGPSSGKGGGNGCSCAVVARDDGAGAGLLAGLGLVLGLFVRRRRGA